MDRQRILSGMRPTGPLHLGHLVGALDNWRDLQEECDCFYMVADWHALLSEYHDPSRISEYSRTLVAEWIACGVDPKNSTMFIQSQVPEHCELQVVLSAITPIGWVERCPTYKEQLKELANKDVNTYGFLGYPVLQAADILVYRAHAVPVGEDQLPHLEITREIARRFNSLFGKVFREPEAKVTKTGRLLGLDRRKMSKSYGNVIALGEEEDVVRKKVMSMITDPQRARRSDPGRPWYCNVHSYYEAFAPREAEEVAEGCRNATIGCTDCKRRLAEVLVGVLAPIKKRRAELLGDRDGLEDIIEQGCEVASREARRTMSAVHQAIMF